MIAEVRLQTDTAVKICGVLCALGVSAVKSSTPRLRRRELRRLAHDFSRALRHRQLQSVIGAVRDFGDNVDRIEMLPHHRLRQAGAEFDALSLPGNRTSASSRRSFSTASSASFSPVSPSTSATVVAS